MSMMLTPVANDNAQRPAADSGECLKLRRATSLVIEPRDGQFLVHNFLANSYFYCNTRCVEFLGELGEWTDIESLFERYADVNPKSLAAQIRRLLEEEALIAEGTPQAERDAEYHRDWEWGAIPARYHFSIRNNPFLTGPEQREAIRRRRAEAGPSPPLVMSHEGLPDRHELPRITSSPLMDTVRRRRSARRYTEAPIGLQALADCLFAGKGIVGQVSDPDFGTVPLATTPSGGARNPYELYVFANRVEDLERGYYHYSGLEHELALVNDEAEFDYTLLAGQKWSARAAAIVFLVADFRRTAWKYTTPPAYRIALMEAGCIAQNIALAATSHGLSATPTGAMSESRVESILDCRDLAQSVILALVIGEPDPSAMPDIRPPETSTLTQAN